MTKECMNVHKALSELKVLEKRIRDAIDNGTFIVANKHSNERIKGMTIPECNARMRSDYQKVNDLIRRRDALKRAVVMSNAVTIVAIGGVNYTIAEAIDMKNHGMLMKKALLYELNSQYNHAQNLLNANSGDALERRAEQYVLSIIQAQPKDSKMAVDSDAMKKFRAEYIANNIYDLVDPNAISKQMESIRKEIEDFESDVDAALSTSNATTTIEFEY